MQHNYFSLILFFVFAALSAFFFTGIKIANPTREGQTKIEKNISIFGIYLGAVLLSVISGIFLLKFLK